MPFIRLKEIRGMSHEERVKKLSELQTELSKLKAQIKVGSSIENPSRIREIKKSVARILTIESEQQSGAKV